jgi:hypothetical protein
MTNVWMPGMARIPGSGRAKGTPNKRTALIRAGIKNAIETLRTGGGEDPIAAAFKIARFLEEMSAKRLEKFQNQIADLPPDEFARIQDGLIAAANLHVRLAEFAFPKLARVDHIGDAPSPAAIEKFKFVLRIDDPLGRPILDDGDRSASGDGS